MIPKIIHYCWFGKGLMPKSQKDCIKGWKKLMPDYTFMRWDESTFDLDAHPLAKYACEVKKYALASDVCRYNVLTEYGGIYLDTDVEVFKRFDDYLQYNFFSGIELYNEFVEEHIQEKYLNPDGTAKDPTKDVPRLEILTSSMGCCQGHEMIKEIRDLYESMPASAEYALNYREHVNNDRLVARYLSHYGFRYVNETQEFGDNMIVMKTGTFGHAFCPEKGYTVSYHHNAATWEQERWTRTQKMAFLFDKVGLLPVYKSYKSVKRKIKKHLLHPVCGEIWCLHRVVDQRSGYNSNRELEITPDYLEKKITDYHKKGYRFVSIDNLLNHGVLSPAKRVNISFDDGFVDIFDKAYPIFLKYKIPFTVYLTTGFPDGNADLWWIQLERFAQGDAARFEEQMKQIYDSGLPMAAEMHRITSSECDAELCKSLSLTWEQLKEMVDSGLCTIGSHTCSHPGLTRIPEKEMKTELEESKKRIELMLGINVRHFSYPHSMQDETVVKALRETGYRTATLGYGGKIRKGDNPFLLNREYIIER